MSIGTFSYPMPVNEPVLNYLPGSPEKKKLKAVLAELKKVEIDVPMYIGGKDVRTNKKGTLHPPHEISHTLGTYSEGNEKHVTQAIDAALAASIFHFKEIDIPRLKAYLRKKNIPVRT